MGVQPAVFLDRDGTINVDSGYPFRQADFQFATGAVEGLQCLNNLPMALIVVTNQSGVARGLFTEADVKKFHGIMERQILEHGGRIDDWIWCPHLPEAPIPGYAQHCHCRKPMPGMLQTMARKHAIDLEKSFMIGDSERDVEAGLAAGCTTIRLAEAGTKTRAAHLADNLHEAAKWIERQSTSTAL